MAMQDKVVVNGIDVTDKRITWDNNEEWDIAIGTIDIKFAPSVNTLLTIEEGMEITITRGFVTDTDEYVFRGVITQVKPNVSKIVCVCKNPLYDAIKSRRTKSWDKDIDTELGIGSEIFKSLCDHSQLSYTDDSVPSTGTETAQKIVKFIQNDEDDFDRMQELAERYQRVITYDYDNDIVNFKEKGYTIYPVSLNVGIEIQNQIDWKNNMEQLINKVTVNGATVYDKIIQTFAGPGTEFTLSNTPEDTEVHINHASTNDLQTRGQKDVGTIGTNFDYYVDVENKKIVFSASVSDVWINYGAQVPMPVIRKRQASIDKYGGPNKIPHHRKFTFNDIKDINDAEARAKSILDKYSTPFIEAQDLQINDTVIETYGSIKPGTVIRVIDSFNNKDVTVFVKGVKKAWPHIGDSLMIGDEIWRTEDWQASVSKKINQLFNELNKNQDILNTIYDFEHDSYYERRYFLRYKRDETNDGAWGVGFTDGATPTLYNWGAGGIWQASYENEFAIASINQGDNTYKEFVYDDFFYDDTLSSNIVWNTTTKEISFTSGGILYTKPITIGHAYTHFTVTLASLTGTVDVEISGDGGVTYQSVVLGQRTAFTSSDDTSVIIRIKENALTTATIANTYYSGKYLKPAIYCKLEG